MFLSVFRDYHNQSIPEKIQIIMLYVCMRNDNKLNIEISRWSHNQDYGYVFSLKKYIPDASEQLNILVYEHRNTQSIMWYHWNHFTFNEINSYENSGIKESLSEDKQLNEYGLFEIENFSSEYASGDDSMKNADLLIPLANRILYDFKKFISNK